PNRQSPEKTASAVGPIWPATSDNFVHLKALGSSPAWKSTAPPFQQARYMLRMCSSTATDFAPNHPKQTTRESSISMSKLSRTKSTSNLSQDPKPETGTSASFDSMANSSRFASI